RLALRVAEVLRQRVREELPVFVRISAADWADGGWDIEQSVVLARHLKELGVDLIDVSSGALVPKVRIPVGKGYQVPFARTIRAEAGILTGAVGLITEPRQASEIITGGDADLVFIARELLREPYWAIKAQQELGVERGSRNVPGTSLLCRPSGCVVNNWGGSNLHLVTTTISNI